MYLSHNNRYSAARAKPTPAELRSLDICRELGASPSSLAFNESRGLFPPLELTSPAAAPSVGELGRAAVAVGKIWNPCSSKLLGMVLKPAGTVIVVRNPFPSNVVMVSAPEPPGTCESGAEGDGEDGETGRVYITGIVSLSDTNQDRKEDLSASTSAYRLVGRKGGGRGQRGVLY